MKKVFNLRLLLVVVVLLTTTVFFGQQKVKSVSSLILEENFDYTVEALLTDNSWAAHSSSGTQPIDVVSGLTFEGYAGSNVGGAANLDNNGEDVNRSFTAQTSGTVYVAAIIQINANTSEGYFFHLGRNVIGSTYFSRIWINNTANGINITNANTPPTSYFPITAGTPFLLVIKHDFDNDTTKMFILNTYSETEPVVADTAIEEVLTEIGSVALRQYYTSQRIVVDGIRVANTWNDAVAVDTLTNIKNSSYKEIIYVSGGNIVVNSQEDSTIEVYNIHGQKLISQTMVEGVNTIRVDAKGVVFVKVNNRVMKVMM